MSFAFDVVKDGKNILDDNYPAWKVDVRKNPKTFGLVQVVVNRLSTTTINLITVDHNYGYIPSFIVAWNYPGGPESTFGIGILQQLSPTFFTVNYQVDEKQFKINAVGDASGDTTNIYLEFRYYIFVEDFPLVASQSVFFT